MRPVHLSRVESDPFAAGDSVELLDVGLPDLSGAQLMATLEEAIAQEPMTNVIARLRAIAAAAPAAIIAPEPALILEPTPLTALEEASAAPLAEAPLALTPEMLVNSGPTQTTAEVPAPATAEPRAETADPKGPDSAKIFDEDFFEFI